MSKPGHLLFVVVLWSFAGQVNAQMANGFQRVPDEAPNLVAMGESISSVTTQNRANKVDFDQFTPWGHNWIEGSTSTVMEEDGCLAENEIWIESEFSPQEGHAAAEYLSLFTDGGAFGSARRPNQRDKRNALSRCKVRETGFAEFEIVADPRRGLNTVGRIQSNIDLQATCTNPDKCFAEGFLSKHIGDTRIDATFDWQTQTWTIVGQIHEDQYDFEAKKTIVKIVPVNDFVEGPDLNVHYSSSEIVDVGHKFSVSEINVFGAGARVIQGEDVALDYDLEMENYGESYLIIIR